MIRKVLTMGLGVILLTNQFSCKDRGAVKIEIPNEVDPISVPSTTLYEVDPSTAPSITLLEAVSAGSWAEVDGILKQNTEDLNQKDPEGLTPLHIAAKEGFTRIVNLLITAGADINAQDQNGETPLHKAVISDHPVVVKQLLNAGADANIQSKLGRPIYYAVRVLGNPQMIELLRDVSIVPGRTELDPNIPPKKYEIDLDPSPPASQQVENKTFRYRITDIPLDWELMTHQQDTFLVYKAISLFNLPPVWSELEKQNIKNAVSLKVWKMGPEDTLDSFVKDHNARTAQGRQSMQEVPNEFGKAFVQLVEDGGLIYKTRYHAIFYNQFGYILEFVATPGTYDTNLPKFLDFTRKIELLSSSGQWEKPKPVTSDAKTDEISTEKISIATHPELYGFTGTELSFVGWVLNPCVSSV